MDVVKELASDDKAYIVDLELVLEIIQQAQKMGFKLILTTDHGTINVKKIRLKVVGDKNTSLNLRYKTGRSL
jgi:histidinol phosphatase-like PHP family hydrolase